MPKRDYANASNAVRSLYREKRLFQTYTRASELRDKYCSFETPLRLTMWQALQQLRNIHDSSDPDMEVSNDIHALQTAQRMMNENIPERLVLLGLIHDVGKILYLKGCDEDGTSLDTQWSVVGDDFVVGYPLPDCCIYPEFNHLNQDTHDHYAKGIGLSNVVRSFGHDEYLYQVLRHNQSKHTLSEDDLYIIRFHSLYPWHSGGAYKELENSRDRHLKPLVQTFQQFDLYSKGEEEVDWNDDKWKRLVEAYFGDDELEW